MQKNVNFIGFTACFLIFATKDGSGGNSDICTRSVTEYLLPKAEQTHEIIYVPGKNMLLITQFSNSKFLKAETAPSTGDIVAVEAFLIGKSTSGLHGLAASDVYAKQNQYWVSLQNDNKLIRLDPKVNNISAEPEILQTITVPSPGKGPHHVAEYGMNIWTTLKDSDHVLRINHKKPSDYKLYKAHPSPVFLAQHPISKDIYVGEYKENTILRIHHVDDTISRIQVPSNVGESPVGIVSNSKFTWVALLSIKSKGTGGFGKIYANGTAQWFRLKTPLGRKAALLHVAFNPAELNKARPRVWFLSSSVEDPNAFDMIIKANFDKNYERFDREQVVFLPSQGIKAHRVTASSIGFYITELTSSRIALYKRTQNDTSCNFNFDEVVVSEQDVM